MTLSAMRLRAMTMQDVAAGVRLNQMAGWNQTASDWQRFLNVSPCGCFVAELDGHVSGTVVTLSFQNRFAWIGMVLVDPPYRGRGIGTDLLKRAIRYLDDEKIATLKLDATPQGKPLYQKLGFVPEYEIERWTLRRPATDVPNSFASGELASAPLLSSILDADQEVFGADRSFLLESLHRDAPDLTLGVWDSNVLRGYALGRRGLFADHLGPWMAPDSPAATTLLERFLARSSRETIVVDCLKSNHSAVELLRSCGFTYSRPLTRMYRGPNDHPGRPEFLCAILGPEFG
jgi:GNAT superfamily N-acetyltransferase